MVSWHWEPKSQCGERNLLGTRGNPVVINFIFPFGSLGRWTIHLPSTLMAEDIPMDLTPIKEEILLLSKDKKRKKGPKE